MSNAEGDSHPIRVCLKKDEIEGLTKEQLVEKWFQQDKYIDLIETKPNEADNSELVSLRESEEKLKQQQLEATRRENILVMRLTTKEQEMQEYANQIQELKQGQIPTVAQLRSALLDPAVNLMFERLRKELESTKARLEETQNELSAWKFTPDSNTGKRLMAKCRLLYQENEELGKMISSGRMAKLEGDLALQRNFSEEMKKSQNELDEFLLELDEDVEGMQNTIYYLQQQLKESKDNISRLQQEKDKIGFNAVIKDSLLPERTESPMPVVVKKELIIERMTNGKESPEHNSILDNDECTDNGPQEEELEIEVTDEIQDLVCESRDISEMPLELTILEKPQLNSSSTSNETIDVETITSLAKEETVPEPVKDVESVVHSSGVVEENSTETDDVSRSEEKDSTGRSDCETVRSSTPLPPVENPERIKRTRDSTDEVSQSPKRPRHNEDTTPPSEEIGACVDIDTDTEVQVAQTLACWAAASKGRIEAQITEQTCQPVGNGEVDDTSSVSD